MEHYNYHFHCLQMQKSFSSFYLGFFTLAISFSFFIFSKPPDYCLQFSPVLFSRSLQIQFYQCEDYHKPQQCSRLFVLQRLSFNIWSSRLIIGSLSISDSLLPTDFFRPVVLPMVSLEETVLLVLWGLLDCYQETDIQLAALRVGRCKATVFRIWSYLFRNFSGQ